MDITYHHVWGFPDFFNNSTQYVVRATHVKQVKLLMRCAVYRFRYALLSTHRV
jgi:hypothetical protein